MANEKPVETKSNVLAQIKELRDQLETLQNKPTRDEELERLQHEVNELRRMIETLKGSDQHFRGS